MRSFLKVDRRMTQTACSNLKTNPNSVSEFLVNLMANRRKKE
jgi:hypothetical protein